MKILFLILGLIGASGSASAQANSKIDIWSGAYAVHLVAKNGSTPVENPFKQTIIIQPSESDPGRWISPNGEGGTDVTMKEFSFGLDGQEDEYGEFGWTELHREKKINCIGGGYFFVCQTQPNATVKLWEKPFFSRTGIFGAMLQHRRLYEFERIVQNVD